MTDPGHAVVKIATSREQAQVFVALLRAAGIPAFCDPDNAADEFAVSQRLMNLTSVKVYAPAREVERARQVLAPMAIDPEELERQALEADDPEVDDA